MQMQIQTDVVFCGQTRTHSMWLVHPPFGHCDSQRTGVTSDICHPLWPLYCQYIENRGDLLYMTSDI